MLPVDGSIRLCLSPRLQWQVLLRLLLLIRLMNRPVHSWRYAGSA
jgi:hypothetical protein